ncbi:MAG TPA: metal-sulfur cluster assembly factor [Thermomicrobiales bacterium]|nr:metal-sulfur cluster assembly factor [Thermomicrobiales bacterium]
MTTPTLSPGQLLESLMQVIDPEVGINIVDLGLVYAVDLTGASATVEMTLTTPGCPLHASIEAAVKRALMTNHPELNEVNVQLVWDPRWNVDFITEEGRRQLGW